MRTLTKIQVMFCLVAAFSAGCVSIRSKSVSQAEKGGGHRIGASLADYGYVHLTVPQIDVMPRLRAQCPNGSVTGIETTLTCRDFLILQYYEAKAEAWCQ